MTLRGEAFTPVARGDSAWVPFTLDLESGACSDGIYEKQMRGAIRVLPETSNRR